MTSKMRPAGCWWPFRFWHMTNRLMAAQIGLYGRIWALFGAVWCISHRIYALLGAFWMFWLTYQPQRPSTIRNGCLASFWPLSGRFFALFMVISFVWADIQPVSDLPYQAMIITHWLDDLGLILGAFLRSFRKFPLFGLTYSLSVIIPIRQWLCAAY